MSQIILKTSLVIEGSPKSSFWGKNFEGKSQKGFFCQKTIHVYSLPKFVSLKTGACPTISVYLFLGLGGGGGGEYQPNDFDIDFWHAGGNFFCNTGEKHKI